MDTREHSGQCDQIWQNFAHLAKSSKSCAIFQGIIYYLLLGKILNLLWQFLSSFLQILIDVNGQMLKKSSNLVTTIADSHDHLLLMVSNKNKAN